MYKRKYINPEPDLSEAIVKRSSGGDLTEAKTFVNDWNSKRESQLNENVQSATNLPFLGGLYRNSLKNNVDTVKVTDSNLEQDVLGAYFPLTHKIALNTDSEDTKIHEVAHASKPKAQEAKIRQLKSRQNYLRKGVTPNEYLDSDSEIYARLMTLRKSLNLDPNKHYSISEIRKIIDKHSNYTIGVPSRSKKGGYKITTIDGNGRVKSSIGTNKDLDYSKSEINTIIEDPKSIFDRYTPDFIEGLFNEVADNRSSIPMAALGMSTASWVPQIADWHRQAFGKTTTYDPYYGRAAMAKQGYREVAPVIQPIEVDYEDDEEDTTPVREDTPAQSSTPAATPAPLATTTTPAPTTPATPTAKTPATTVTEEQIDYNAPGDAKSPGYFVISKEDMTIKALDTKGRVIYSFPIAVGKAYGNKKVKGDMKTPEGEFTIQEILNASSWTHDFNDGKGVIKGAYGPWFLRLKTPGHSGIGIHGTHDPASMGTRASEGCIRLRNEDIQKLRTLAKVGMRVIIQGSRKDAEADGVAYVAPKAAHLYATRTTPYAGPATTGGWRKYKRDRVSIPYNVVQNKNIGHMTAVTDLFDKYGIKYRISSGVRNYHLGNAGGKSWHLDGRALDIAAPTGMSNEAFLRQFVGNKALLDEMKAMNYGIINEYIPANLRRTGGTGGHLHIGPDDWAWNNHALFYDPNMSLFS